MTSDLLAELGELSEEEDRADVSMPSAGRTADHLHCLLTSAKMAELIRTAEQRVCFVGPGLQKEPAMAMEAVASQIGSHQLAVSVDFNERVFRMGWGDVDAVKILRDAGIRVGDSRGLRSGLLIVDDAGFSYTPNAYLLESESGPTLNALRLSPRQAHDIANRLICPVDSDETDEPVHVVDLPGLATEVEEDQFNEVKKRLDEVPPMKFDVVRQVNVFAPYLQFVELSLHGAELERKTYTIPRPLTEVGRFRDLDGRMKTTFELIGTEQKKGLSARSLRVELDQIRKEYTRELPPKIGRGRVFLKARKGEMRTRLDQAQEDLKRHQEHLKNSLQQALDESRERVIDYYLPRLRETPPSNLLTQCDDRPTSRDVRLWIGGCLSNFPRADTVVNKMRLRVEYKDVTYETLNNEGFIEWVTKAFPDVDWDKPLQEFKVVKGDTPRT